MCAGLRLIGNFSVTPSPTVLSELASVSLDQQLTDWTRLIGWRASEICLVHVVWGSELGSSCFAQPTCTVPTLSSEAALCGMHLLPPCLENKKKKKCRFGLKGYDMGQESFKFRAKRLSQDYLDPGWFSCAGFLDGSSLSESKVGGASL